MGPIRLSCFAPGIREWARRIRGKRGDFSEEVNTTDSLRY